MKSHKKNLPLLLAASGLLAATFAGCTQKAEDVPPLNKEPGPALVGAADGDNEQKTQPLKPEPSADFVAGVGATQGPASEAVLAELAKIREEKATLDAQLAAFNTIGGTPSEIAERLASEAAKVERLEGENKALEATIADSKTADEHLVEAKAAVEKLNAKLADYAVLGGEPEAISEKLKAAQGGAESALSDKKRIEAILTSTTSEFAKISEELGAEKTEKAKFMSERDVLAKRLAEWKGSHKRAVDSATRLLAKDQADLTRAGVEADKATRHADNERHARGVESAALAKALAERDNARTQAKEAEGRITRAETVAVASEGRTLALLAKMDAEVAAAGGDAAKDGKTLARYVAIRKKFRTGEITMQEFEAQSRAAVLSN
jgi:hypothetical protein